VKRQHDSDTCALHWRLGPFSSGYPGPCFAEICHCACHANGVEDLLTLMAKLGIKSAAARMMDWDQWVTYGNNGEERDSY
jgi:hypothetical protein